MANIMAPELPEKIQNLPLPFRNIVSRCLVKNASERIQKAETLLELLQEKDTRILHPTFSKEMQNGNGKSDQEPEEDKKIVLKSKSENQTLIKHPTKKISFSIDNDITTPVKQPQSSKRKKLLMIVALLLLVVYFLCFNKFMRNNAIDNSTARPVSPEQNTVIPVKDSTKANSNRSENQVTAADTSVNNNAKTDPATKPSESKKKTSNTPFKKNNSTNKLVVELSATEACIISFNEKVIGELNEDEIMKIYLVEGSHMLTAKAKNSNRSYSKPYNVLKRDLNKSSSLRIVLR